DQRAMDHGDGMIHVVYGTPGGLRTADAESWSQNTLKGRPRYFDRFGSALAAGDLDGDGCAELAVGAPGENAAHILRGTRGGGLTRAGNLLLTGKGGGFGAALAIVPAEDRGAGLVVAAPRAGRLVLFRPDGGRAGVALPTGPDASLYGYAMAPWASGRGGRLVETGKRPPPAGAGAARVRGRHGAGPGGRRR